MLLTLVIFFGTKFLNKITLFMVFFHFLHHIFYFIFILSLNCISHHSSICIVSVEDFPPITDAGFFFTSYVFWLTTGRNHFYWQYQPSSTFCFVCLTTHSLWREEGKQAAVTFFVFDPMCCELASSSKGWVFVLVVGFFWKSLLKFLLVML